MDNAECLAIFGPKFAENLDADVQKWIILDVRSRCRKNGSNFAKNCSGCPRPLFNALCSILIYSPLNVSVHFLNVRVHIENFL